MIFLLCAIALIICSIWIPNVRAGARSTIDPLIPGTLRVDYPLNLTCTVTVDSTSTEKPVLAGDARKATGFVAPDTAEGILIRLDSEWLV